jgi:peptide deformylase
VILPIYTYGQNVLNTKGEQITKDYPNLNVLIEDMFQTMKQAFGIGLAAQQIGLPIKLFVIDLTEYGKVDEALIGFKKVFINSEIIEASEEERKFEEGCLSFPGFHIDVTRPEPSLIKPQEKEAPPSTFNINFYGTVTDKEYAQKLFSDFTRAIESQLKRSR